MLTWPAGLSRMFEMTLTAPMTVFSQRLPSRGTSAAMPPAATTLPELASEPVVRKARLDSTSCWRRAEALGAVSASSRQHVPSTSLHRGMPAWQRAIECTCGTLQNDQRGRMCGAGQKGHADRAKEERLTICQDACYDYGNPDFIQSVRCSAWSLLTSGQCPRHA